MLKTTENKYDGVIVDHTSLPETAAIFSDEISSLLSSLKEKQLLWVKVPIGKSEFIPVLTKLGFEFHHCDEQSVSLVKKLENDAFVPTTKNYILGVGAVVLDGDQLLVVRDRFWSGYKLPGGHVDKNEFIKDAVKREVYEETGVHVDFESIMNLGHFRAGQFGESNIYIGCTARPLTKQISIKDTSEILEAKWIHYEDFLNAEETNTYNKSVVKAAIENRELKLTERPMKLRVSGEVFL